jgi:hypothetical protein
VFLVCGDRVEFGQGISVSQGKEIRKSKKSVNETEKNVPSPSKAGIVPG